MPGIFFEYGKSRTLSKNCEHNIGDPFKENKFNFASVIC